MDNQEGVHVGGYIESFAMSGFRKNSSQTVPGGSTEPSVLEYTQLGVAARTSNLVWGAATGGTAYGVSPLSSVSEGSLRIVVLLAWCLKMCPVDV